MMEKVMLGVGCSLEVALAWCISTKHSCDSYGYSPNHLVFAYNPKFPTSDTEEMTNIGESNCK